jgi:uncharacterized membrane protein
MLPASTWTPLIIAHAGLALSSVLLGALLLWGRKGHLAHRIGGWVWVISMAAVATMSFDIRGPEGYSWIHALSVLTLLALAAGVLHARRHRVRAHRSTMISLYLGALLIAGLFTLLPGRLMGHAVWTWLGVTFLHSP